MISTFILCFVFCEIDLQVLPLILRKGTEDSVRRNLPDKCLWIRVQGSEFSDIASADQTQFRELKDDNFHTVKFLSSSRCVGEAKLLLENATSSQAVVSFADGEMHLG